MSTRGLHLPPLLVRRPLSSLSAASFILMFGHVGVGEASIKLTTAATEKGIHLANFDAQLFTRLFVHVKQLREDQHLCRVADEKK